MQDSSLNQQKCSLTIEKLLLTYEDLTKMLSLSRRHLERAVKNRQLVCLKIGRSVRFERDAVTKWLKKTRSHNVQIS